MSFCSSELLPLYIPKAGLRFVIMITLYNFFLQRLQCLPTRTHTHAHTSTSMTRMAKNQTNTTHLLWKYAQSTVRSQHDGFSKKENTLWIKEECMYKMLNGVWDRQTEWNAPTREWKWSNMTVPGCLFSGIFCTTIYNSGGPGSPCCPHIPSNWRDLRNCNTES